MSAGVRPLLLAALAEDPSALGERPVLFVAADDRSAPATWPASSAPTSRPAGSATTPRAEPATSRTWRRRRTSSACGSRRSTRSPAAATGTTPPIVVASAVALAEAVPDASLRPAGFALHKGEEVDLDDVAELLAGAGYERVEQVDGPRPVRGPRRHPRCLRRDRGPRPPGSSCSATRSSRSAGSRPSPSARSARPSGSSSTRRPRSTPTTGCSPRRRSPSAAEEGEAQPAARRAAADRPLLALPRADRSRRPRS